jgi:two-component system sensor histidine kinase PilS (NtrC family)
MIDPFKTDSQQSKLVLKRFALARAVIIGAVALSCAALHMHSGAQFGDNTAYLCAVISIALIGSLVATLVLMTEYAPTMRFSFVLLCTDLIVISSIVLLTGSSRSVFAFLYIVAILSSSILLSFNWSLLFATMCSVCFLLVAVLEGYGFAPAASAFRSQMGPMNTGELWAYTVMKILAFYLTAFLSGYLSRRVGLLQSFQQNILSSFSSGFISVNPDCCVTFLNAPGADILGRTVAECVGEHVLSVFPTVNGEPNPLVQAVTEQREWRGREITAVRGDGEQIPVGITISTLRSSGNNHLGAIASFIDLTELKRMEEMLRRRDRLAAVGEMSASLAHEIRNPVASIRGAVEELAAEDSEDAETNAQLMDIVIKESDQLSKIVTGFLDFVGSGRCEKQLCDVESFLNEVLQSARRCFIGNGKIRIVEQLAPALARINCDRSQIKEALLNIVRNGIEAMPDGGVLLVEVERSTKSADHICIVVQDEGEGLPPGAQEKIFDPFYTTKSNGIGLGLAIVHRIVAAHGGSIEVTSQQGAGTRVSIELPREG